MHAPIPLIGILLVSLGTAAQAQDRIAIRNDTAPPVNLERSGVSPPAVKERTEFYDILGDSEEELQCELKAKGCAWVDGKTYDSVTTWKFSWDYDYVRTETACAATDFRMSLNIVYRYPRWMQDDRAAPDLRRKWKAYMDALVVHETGHRDLAVETANDIVRDVGALTPAGDCSVLDASIRQVCDTRMDELQENTRAYDIGTRHGGSQGAVLE